jgi:hypothetical protein
MEQHRMDKNRQRGQAVTDERNIAHDKTVAQDKKNRGEPVVENASVAPQPGRKPPLLDGDTDPSNSVAHALYKDGATPREQRDAPAGDSKPE